MITRPCATLLAAALVPFLVTPALADLTAEDVWENWKASAGLYGDATVTGEETRSGDTLTISNFAVSLSDTGSRILVEIPLIEFEELGDGSVSIRMSSSYPMEFSFDDPETGSVLGRLRVEHDGLSMQASGDPGAIRQTYQAPQISVAMDELTVDGEQVEATGAFTIRTVAGSSLTGSGAPQQLESTFSAEALVAQFDLSEPDEDDLLINFAMTMENLRSDSSGTMSPFSSGDTLDEMLAAGLATEGTFSHGATRYSLSGGDTEQNFRIDGTVATGSLDVSIGPGGLSYGGSNSDITFVMSGSDIPFPSLSFELRESSGRLTMPLVRSDEPQDFVMQTSLDGLRIDDAIWSLFDPGALLSREPARIVIDIAGKGNWLIDITDPEQAASAETSGEVPGELHALELNELNVEIAGLQLLGEGGFTFDNADTVTFDGMPRPEGRIGFTLLGANAFIDSLVTLGLVPEDQAMGARMMLGMFARPGDGPDSLISTIEVQPDGSVLANGQRIR